MPENLGFDSVSKIVAAINKAYAGSVKSSVNRSITLQIPEGMSPEDFISAVQAIKLDITEEPSVIIDSRSGIVVMGGNVEVSEAALSFNGTQVNIESASAGRPASGTLKYIKSSATIQELIDGMNSVGVSFADMAKILQLLYKNGNLRAKLIVQ